MATVAELEEKLKELTARIEQLEEEVDAHETSIDNSRNQADVADEELQSLYDHIYGNGVRPVAQLKAQQDAAAEAELQRLEAEAEAARRRTTTKG